MNEYLVDRQVCNNNYWGREYIIWCHYYYISVIITKRVNDTSNEETKNICSRVMDQY